MTSWLPIARFDCQRLTPGIQVHLLQGHSQRRTADPDAGEAVERLPGQMPRRWQKLRCNCNLDTLEIRWHFSCDTINSFLPCRFQIVSSTLEVKVLSRKLQKTACKYPIGIWTCPKRGTPTLYWNCHSRVSSFLQKPYWSYCGMILPNYNHTLSPFIGGFPIIIPLEEECVSMCFPFFHPDIVFLSLYTDSIPGNILWFPIESLPQIWEYQWISWNIWVPSGNQTQRTKILHS